jgi:hypothetical protein
VSVATAPACLFDCFDESRTIHNAPKLPRVVRCCNASALGQDGFRLSKRPAETCVSRNAEYHVLAHRHSHSARTNNQSVARVIMIRPAQWLQDNKHLWFVPFAAPLEPPTEAFRPYQISRCGDLVDPHNSKITTSRSTT